MVQGQAEHTETELGGQHCRVPVRGNTHTPLFVTLHNLWASCPAAFLHHRHKKKTQTNRNLFAWLVLEVRQQQFPPAGRWTACMCPHQGLSCSVLSLLVTAYPETHRHGSTTAGHPTHPSLSPLASHTLPTPESLFVNPLPTNFMELLEY